MSETSAIKHSSEMYGGRPGSQKFAKILIVFVVFHLGMTALYLLPSPGPIRSLATSYMQPVFKQSWWVFAPDPVSSNVYLSVRGKKADGTATPWFNITRCDIDSAILHHPVPNRRYLATFQMMRHYQLWRDDLPPKAKQALSQDVSGSDWVSKTRSQLTALGGTPHVVNSFMKSDRAMNILSSAIIESRYGKVSSVQVQIQTVHTRPFAERNSNTPLKTETWQSGATPFTPSDADQLHIVNDLYGTRSGC